jgi:hypothetical protein
MALGASIGLLGWPGASNTDVVAAATARHPRATEVQELSGRLLVPNARARGNDALHALRSALSRLDASIRAAQSDTSPVQLGLLRRQLHDTQTAFGLLRDRLAGRGAVQLASELEKEFQPLWSDVASAVASSSQRAERLAAARARIEAATSRRAEPRGPGVTLLQPDSSE